MTRMMIPGMTMMLGMTNDDAHPAVFDGMYPNILSFLFVC
jgi:hypothetical protein